MAERDVIDDILLLIRSRYPLIVLENAEEQRVESVIELVADRLGLGLFSWRPSNGLIRVDKKVKNRAALYGTADPVTMLGHIEASDFPAIYNLIRFEQYLEDRNVVNHLVEAARKFTSQPGALVITMRGSLPELLKGEAAFVKFPDPEKEEYESLLTHILRDLYQKQDIDYRMNDEELAMLLNNLKGLTLTEAEKILTRIIIEDGALGREDIRAVLDAKKELAIQDGLLEYYPVEESMGDIADLKNLKSWLTKRKKIISEPDKAVEFGLSFPKGVLLLGVPGCGKSLCAKAVAMEWGLPLLKLDPANLYNKYLGESERNFKRAMETAEKMSPVVLWIDEIEKAFSSVGSDQDGGVSMRVFGTFLSWMQDRNGDIFIVATSNNVKKLPPELLRKGRFDEIFFVDLPDSESRAAIFNIHLKKRGKEPRNFDMSSLVVATEGFSGSEIEQVIVSGLYTAFSASNELSTSILLGEIESTAPLSVTMSEGIESLRLWASGRTVGAN